MGFIADLLRRKSVPADEAARSEQVFERIKAARGKETGKWLNLMVDPTQAPAPAPAPTMEDLEELDPVDAGIYTPPIDTMTADADVTMTVPQVWVNGLFDEFARLAQQFNAETQVPALRVLIKRPTLDGSRRFVGNISTSNWGLLVQGLPDKLMAFIAPGDDTIDWTADDLAAKSVEPFLSIEASGSGDQRRWFLDGEQVFADCTPRLARILFGDLIRVATGKVSDAQLFAEEIHLS